MHAEITSAPVAYGNVLSAVLVTDQTPKARGRVLSAGIAAGATAIASGHLLDASLVASTQVLPVPVIQVSVSTVGTSAQIHATGTAPTVDEWAWSITGGGQIVDTDPDVLVTLPAAQTARTRTLTARYRVGESWSDLASATVTIPKWKWWAGVAGVLHPCVPRKGAPASTAARGRVLSVQTVTSTAAPIDETLEPATGVPSEGLFFELPSPQQLTDVPKLGRKILAHYFGPDPGAFSNATSDYYESGYLPVSGEGGIHAAYGGLVRDRPMLGAPWPTTPVSWMRNMQAQEITAAQQAGIDGFFCNIMGSSGANWDRYIWMAEEASANFPGFVVVPMLDATTSMVLNEAPSVAADRINQIISKASAWRLDDGTYPVGTFKIEGAANRTTDPKGPSYWASVASLVQSTHGKKVRWIGVYNNMGQAPLYAGLQWAAGPWGNGADPAIYRALSNQGIAIKSRGEKYLFAVWAQDVRPRSALFDEACNSEALRAALDCAIRQDADIIQIGTWSDHTEGSMLRPTVKQGHAKLDVAAWRIAKWKTGRTPRIIRDAIYLVHRNQTLTATITGGQTSLMAHWARPNRTPAPRDQVEVLTYLTAPATLTVKIGGSLKTWDAPAGEFSMLVPAVPGEVSVKAVRAGVEIARIDSPVVIRSTVVNQDREYSWFSSIRGVAGQYDPTPGAPPPIPGNYI